MFETVCFSHPLTWWKAGNSSHPGCTSLSSVSVGIRSGSPVSSRQSWCFGNHICFFIRRTRHSLSVAQRPISWLEGSEALENSLSFCTEFTFGTARKAKWYSHSFFISFSCFNSDSSIPISRVWQPWQALQASCNVDKSAKVCLLENHWLCLSPS